MSAVVTPRKDRDTRIPVVARTEHPLLKRNYRIATTAIESMVHLVERCVRVLIPGALIYARPRMGKTHGVDYLCLHLARTRPDILAVRLSCEHKRMDYEGPFFNALLAAVGARDAMERPNSIKRYELIKRLRERLAAKNGHVVVLFCDEAQRLSCNGYEWLRDVHDQLAYQSIRLLTFLVGQPQLLAQKAAFQMSGDEQIVARFMIEQLQFHGVRDAAEAATCLSGYDNTHYPAEGGPTFSAYFLPKAFDRGLRLEASGAHLWNAFVRAHASAQLAGGPEIQMDYFTRAIEYLLAEGHRFDAPDLELDESYWTRAVAESGYVGAQRSLIEAIG